MKRLGLSSLYHKRSFKPYKKHKTDLKDYPNIINQNFTSNEPRKLITSDLTYIKLNDSYAYVCFIIDLYNREIISHSIGLKHDSKLVIDSLNKINLKKSDVFHTDRGKEFLNNSVKKILDNYNVKHSLSKPGFPYDNAVSENLFGILKREWIVKKYTNYNKLNNDINEFVKYYNTFRLHSKLEYNSPIEFRIKNS